MKISDRAENRYHFFIFSARAYKGTRACASTLLSQISKIASCGSAATLFQYFNISARCAERNFSPGWNSPCNRALRMSKIDVFFFRPRETAKFSACQSEMCYLTEHCGFFNKRERFELQIIFDTARRIGESKPMTTPFWPHVYFFLALSIVVSVGNKMHMQRCKLHKLNRHLFLLSFSGSWHLFSDQSRKHS